MQSPIGEEEPFRNEHALPGTTELRRSDKGRGKNSDRRPGRPFNGTVRAAKGLPQVTHKKSFHQRAGPCVLFDLRCRESAGRGGEESYQFHIPKLRRS